MRVVCTMGVALILGISTGGVLGWQIGGVLDVPVLAIIMALGCGVSCIIIALIPQKRRELP